MHDAPARPEAEAPPAHAGFRPDIQGLRALAVGLVVLSHADVPGLSGGFVGVDVFFVISGFLITGLLLADAGKTGHVSLARFYTRRALRILPAATLVIVTTAVATTHLLSFVAAKKVLSESVWAGLFAANIKFGRDGTDYFQAGQAISPLQHFWSLAVEEQFYLVWPALLSVTLFGLRGRAKARHQRRRRPRPLLRGRVVLVLLVVGSTSLWLSSTQTASNPTGAYFSTFTRAWELVAGALLATLLSRLSRLPAVARSVLSWAGLGAVLWAAVTFSPATPFPGTAAVLPVLGTCALLVGGIGAPAGGAHLLMSRRPLRWVGDISYSLYLWHWPVLILAEEYAGHALPLWQNVLLILLAVLLSAASYAWVENPVRRSKRIWGPKPGRALVLWPASVACVLAAALVLQPAVPASAGARPHKPGDAERAVKAAVLAARAGERLPESFSPGLDKAATDFHGIKECGAYHGARSEICEFGDAHGSRRMVLLGNSHATMWLPGFQQIARSAHWHLTPLIKEVCTYRDFAGLNDRPTSSIGSYTVATSECVDWYAWALDQVRTLHPELIVLPAYVRDDWEAGNRRLVQDLRATGARVVVLSDVPTIQVVPVRCLLRRGATQRSCLWPQNLGHLGADVVTRDIARAAGADYVEVAKWFCFDRQCPSVIDGVVPYSDGHHVTATYARYLATDLGPELHLDGQAPVRP